MATFTNAQIKKLIHEGKEEWKAVAAWGSPSRTIPKMRCEHIAGAVEGIPAFKVKKATRLVQLGYSLARMEKEIDKLLDGHARDTVRAVKKGINVGETRT